MAGPTVPKEEYYAAKAAELLKLAEQLPEPARAEMMTVVAEYRKLAQHWVAVNRASQLAKSR